MDDIDTEEFINTIESRPALWNSKCDSYSDVTEKKNAWESICEHFIKDFDTKNVTEKNFAALTLKKKWRHIRDSYARELKKQRKLKSGSAVKNHRKYMYFDRLKFLSAIHERTPSSQDQIISIESSPTESQSKPETENKFINTEETNKILNLLAERMQAKNNASADNVEDSDRFFLLSLLNDFKKVPEIHKMDAKYEIMGVIQKYAAASSYAEEHYNRNPQQYEQSGFDANQLNQLPEPENHFQPTEILEMSPLSNLSENSDVSIYPDLFTEGDPL